MCPNSNIWDVDEAGTDGTECSRKVASGWRVTGAIRSLSNSRDLQIVCASLACTCSYVWQ